MNNSLKKHLISNRIKIITSFIVISMSISCTTKKDLLYFQQEDSSHFNVNTIIDQKIKIDDIISVKILSIDTESSKPYNFISEGIKNINNTDILKLEGYLVNSQGNITLPVLGTTKVTDKSTQELEDFLVDKLIKEGHLKKPTVVVRTLNSKITVLGEVKLPGTFNYTEKNLTFLQAIGLAGDLTINGNRNDVMLLRQDGNEKKIIHIDLTKTDWFNSPYYYIKQNDIIVISPNNAKIKSAGIVGNAGTLISFFSVLLTLIVLIKN